MNALIYIMGYPYVAKTQVFNYKFDLKNDMWVNYFVFDGELLETWEIGQLMGGN